jgi:ABC-type antimicrobial peptide transport system permease subunit
MGMTLLSGRGFMFDDNGTAPTVAVLNESAKKRFFGSENPIGASIRLAGTTRLTFEIRTAEAPGSIIPAVRQQVHQIDDNLPLVDIKTLTEQIDQSLMSERLLTTLSSLFASLALALACVGLYGTLAYAVSQRTNEIGIRMALGARRSNVLSLILWEGSKLALIGVVLGAGMALGLTRFMRTLLFDVSPTDAVTFAGAGLLLTIVALTACTIPAYSAASIDPVRALRSE